VREAVRHAGEVAEFGDFGVEGDDVGVEFEDGGGGVVEGGVEREVGGERGGERVKDGGADGEVQRAQNACAEGLVGGDDAVEVAAWGLVRMLDVGGIWGGGAYETVSALRGR
jgi:hypothetical protein